jgi:hypothetical protein
MDGDSGTKTEGSKMKLDYVPLLQIQRDLYRLPRGLERFQEYLKTMIDPETADLKLPLVAMNPMGKNHIPRLLDGYLALEADAVAAASTVEAGRNLEAVEGEFKVTLVLTDDAEGGWTNRYTSEFAHHFQSQALTKRGWLAGLLWTSENPSSESVCKETLLTIYRAAHILQHGYALTLREMLVQEAYAMSMAGCVPGEYDGEELNYIRDIIHPYLNTKDYPTLIACLFGDEAANSLGYQPLGLPERAGYLLAHFEYSE